MNEICPCSAIYISKIYIYIYLELRFTSDFSKPDIVWLCSKFYLGVYEFYLGVYELKNFQPLRLTFMCFSNFEFW